MIWHLGEKMHSIFLSKFIFQKQSSNIISCNENNTHLCTHAVPLIHSSWMTFSPLVMNTWTHGGICMKEYTWRSIIDIRIRRRRRIRVPLMKLHSPFHSFVTQCSDCQKSYLSSILRSIWSSSSSSIPLAHLSNENLRWRNKICSMLCNILWTKYNDALNLWRSWWEQNSYCRDVTHVMSQPSRWRHTNGVNILCLSSYVTNPFISLLTGNSDLVFSLSICYDTYLLPQVRFSNREWERDWGDCSTG